MVRGFDRLNSGHSLERLLTVFRNGPRNNAEPAENLIDLHAVSAQFGGDIADPGEVLVIHRHADANHAPQDTPGSDHTGAARGYCGAWTRPAPTSTDGNDSRRACCVNVDHRSPARRPVTSHHRAAIPEACGVAMLVPEMVL